MVGCVGRKHQQLPNHDLNLTGLKLILKTDIIPAVPNLTRSVRGGRDDGGRQPCGRYWILLEVLPHRPPLRLVHRELDRWRAITRGGGWRW